MIFGQTIDDSLSDEIKITVIATGFAPKNPEDNIDINSSFQFAESFESSIPPLLREVEVEQTIAQPVEVEAVQEPVQEVVEEVVAPAEPEKKGRELPAFMRKLFRK
jgi:cell division GTPase FtsZ